MNWREINTIFKRRNCFHSCKGGFGQCSNQIFLKKIYHHSIMILVIVLFTFCKYYLVSLNEKMERYFVYLLPQNKILRMWMCCVKCMSVFRFILTLLIHFFFFGIRFKKRHSIVTTASLMSRTCQSVVPKSLCISSLLCYKN